MLLTRIRYRVLLAVGVATALGLTAVALFYTRYQEATILRQNERAMVKLAESITHGLQSVMLAGSADIAEAYIAKLRQVPEILSVDMLRSDGMEAFRDNKTIEEVNARRGEEVFLLREIEHPRRVLAAEHADLALALKAQEPVWAYQDEGRGREVLVLLAPVLNSEPCYKCHGKAKPVRGVLRLTTNLEPVRRTVQAVREQSLVVLTLALMGTMLLTGYVFGKIVVRPVERVTDAMTRVSSGDLDHRVEVVNRDELGVMAHSFNRMTSELKTTYDLLKRDRNKLTTIIESAHEGIVVANADGTVVLVNSAALELLGKSELELIAGGFDALLDNPRFMAACLAADEAQEMQFHDRVLLVRARRIAGSDGQPIGNAVLLRDISERKRLHNELLRLSTTDGLTGLFNRRFLDQTLAAEYRRAQRTHGELSLLIFDIDHFKRFNDTHGHDQGDRVLQCVARLLREGVRGFDFPCRYGGEEFVAILPGVGPDKAMDVAERLRRNVETTAVDGLNVSISIGVASFPTLSVSDGAALLQRADAALYAAKQGGRNRVVAAENQA